MQADNKKKRFLQNINFFLPRTPYAVLPPNTEYDQIFDENNYDSAKELEQGLPYGIQNVFDGTSARTPRSKSHLPKGQVKEVQLIFILSHHLNND